MQERRSPGCRPSPPPQPRAKRLSACAARRSVIDGAASLQTGAFCRRMTPGHTARKDFSAPTRRYGTATCCSLLGMLAPHRFSPTTRTKYEPGGASAETVVVRPTSSAARLLLPLDDPQAGHIARQVYRPMPSIRPLRCCPRVTVEGLPAAPAAPCTHRARAPHGARSMLVRRPSPLAQTAGPSRCPSGPFTPNAPSSEAVSTMPTFAAPGVVPTSIK